MSLTALVEKLDNQSYRAAIVHPFAMESEGATEDEAVSRLREMALARLKTSKVVEIPMPGDEPENPWAKMAGMFKDHPDWDQYLEAIKEHRREMDLLEPR
ncbi:MAG: type II toxin-antitoxin system HicB family antitoxin [Planctomycetales bacterium]